MMFFILFRQVSHKIYWIKVFSDLIYVFTQAMNCIVDIEHIVGLVVNYGISNTYVLEIP